MNQKFTISLIVGGLLSILALYFAFRNVPIAALIEYLKSVNYFWLLPTIFIIVLTFVFRVFRWQLLLKGSQPIPYWSAFHPLMIAFMMNCILPGRVGELARPILLKKERQIPMATGFATVAAERLFDIVTLIILFAAVFSTIGAKPDLQIHFGNRTVSNATLQSGAVVLIRLGLALLGMIFLFAISSVRNSISRLVLFLARLPLLSRSKIGPLVQKASQFGIIFIENFAQGLSLVASPMRLIGCVLLTGLIWACTVCSYYLFSLGFPGLTLSMWEWTTVMVIVCFFIALPSVPGFWGLWEAGGVFALALFGINNHEAVAYTLVNHAAQIFPVIVIGLLSALVTSVNIFKVQRTESALESNS